MSKVYKFGFWKSLLGLLGNLNFGMVYFISKFKLSKRGNIVLCTGSCWYKVKTNLHEGDHLKGKCIFKLAAVYLRLRSNSTVQEKIRRALDFRV